MTNTDIDIVVDSLKRSQVILEFKGEITPDLINDLLDEVEDEMIKLDEPSKVRKKVFNVLVEGLQNLYHHNENLPPEILSSFGDKFGVIIVTKDSKGYTITMGNFVDALTKSNLLERIQKINGLSDEELKNMYKFILDNQKRSTKGGGGLGLIDMARKSKSKLDYNFIEFDNNWYFYNLNIILI